MAHVSALQKLNTFPQVEPQEATGEFAQTYDDIHSTLRVP